MANFLDFLFGPPKPAKLDALTDKAGARRAQARHDVRAEALRQVRESGAKVMTPERAELLRKAMEVHRAKQTVLADLSDEQRQKLVAMAIRQLLNEGRDPE